jgi:hypothetical protein
VVGEYACEFCFDRGQRWAGEVLRRCSRMDEFSVGELETPAAVAVADGIGAPAAP